MTTPLYTKGARVRCLRAGGPWLDKPLYEVVSSAHKASGEIEYVLRGIHTGEHRKALQEALKPA